MSKKSIAINPDFFNFKKRKKKDKKEKPSFKKNKLKPNDVKKKLIARIKEHQKKEREKEIKEKQEKEENTFENEFQSTLSYLEEMKKKKRKQKIEKKKRKTLKNKQKLQQQQQQQQQQQEQQQQNNIQVDIQPMDLKKDPPYGCLKGGSKPTWKQYNKTLKNNKQQILSEFKSKPIFNLSLNESDEFNQRKDKLKELQSKFKGIGDIVKPKRHRIKTRRIRRKITLGKNRKKNQVGVLVKNKQTRRIIKNEVNVLKRKSINEVKEYLRKHNLIKIGTNAPDHILRSMYESAYLTGEVKNKNADVLLHNWKEEI